MTFEADVKKAAKRINKSVEDVGQKVVKSWFNGTVFDTPADTGRLRGNWQVSKDSPKNGVVARTGASGPIADIRSTVKKPANYWLTNNLPYAAVAEYGRWGTGPGATDKTTRDGFSIQAPYGMARVNLVRVKKNLKLLGVR
jgi:hypothetical protein